MLDLYNLRHACEALNKAFDDRTYQVGSSLWKPDYRDVDVRVMLPDDEYARMFPGGGGHFDATWAILCAAISEWLNKRTGLPIDFQFQQQTAANAEFSKRRDFLGVVAQRKSDGQTNDPTTVTNEEAKTPVVTEEVDKDAGVTAARKLLRHYHPTMYGEK